MSSTPEIKVSAKDIDLINEYISTTDVLRSVKKIYPDKSDDGAYKYFERLSKTVEFAKAVEDSKSNALKRLNLTMEDITKDLLEIKNRCMQSTPVLDKEGTPTGEYRFDASNAIKAVDALGKHIGYYEKDNSRSIEVKTVKEYVETNNPILLKKRPEIED